MPRMKKGILGSLVGWGATAVANASLHGGAYPDSPQEDCTVPSFCTLAGAGREGVCIPWGGFMYPYGPGMGAASGMIVEVG